MSIAVDAVIIIVVLLIIAVAAKKGLIRSVMGLFSSIASLIAAYAFTPVLSEYIRDNFLLDKVTANINETLKGWALDTTSDLYNLDRLVTEPNADFANVLGRYGVGIERISEKLRGLVGVGENEVNSIAKDIASPTSNILASAIAFILIFAAAFIVLSLITLMLDAIFKLPVLSGLNKALGWLFGIIEAIVVASILSLALSVLVTALGAISPGLFGAETIENTVVCKFLVEHNLFTWITEVLGV